jgi:hypothetical protein
MPRVCCPNPVSLEDRVSTESVRPALIRTEFNCAPSHSVTLSVSCTEPVSDAALRGADQRANAMRHSKPQLV